VFSGPKQKRLFANYPDNTNTEVAESEERSCENNKGKQPEDQFQGLLQIDELEPQLAITLTLLTNKFQMPMSGDHLPSLHRSTNIIEWFG